MCQLGDRIVITGQNYSATLSTAVGWSARCSRIAPTDDGFEKPPTSSLLDLLKGLLDRDCGADDSAQVSEVFSVERGFDFAARTGKIDVARIERCCPCVA